MNIWIKVKWVQRKNSTPRTRSLGLHYHFCLLLLSVSISNTQSLINNFHKGIAIQQFRAGSSQLVIVRRPDGSRGGRSFRVLAWENRVESATLGVPVVFHRDSRPVIETWEGVKERNASHSPHSSHLLLALPAGGNCQALVLCQCHVWRLAPGRRSRIKKSPEEQGEDTLCTNLVISHLYSSGFTLFTHKMGKLDDNIL